jgi:hypothetical protein
LTGTLPTVSIRSIVARGVEYAHLVVKRERSGNPISVADAQIAGICIANQAGLATRKTKDFANATIKLYNPWIDE